MFRGRCIVDENMGIMVLGKRDINRWEDGAMLLERRYR